MKCYYQPITCPYIGKDIEQKDMVCTECEYFYPNGCLGRTLVLPFILILLLLIL